jgi:hypothetical protein
VETRTAGSASGLGRRTDGNIGTAPQADSTIILMLVWRNADRPRTTSPMTRFQRQAEMPAKSG